MRIKIFFSYTMVFFFSGLVLSGLHAGATVGEGIAHYDTLPHEAQEILKNSGWLQGPSTGDMVKAVLWVGGSLGLLKYLSVVLKRDKQARLLKLQRQQATQGAVNPMAQLLRALQMQQDAGGNGEGLAGEPVLEEAEPVTEEQLEWNPHDILSTGKRRFFSILSWVAAGLAVASVINAADRLKDAYRGNTVPSAVRACINRHGDLEKEVGEARKVIEQNPGLATDIANDLRKKYGLTSLRGVVSGAEAMNKMLSARNEDTTEMIKSLNQVRENNALVRFAQRSGLNVLGWFAYKFKGGKKKA